MKFNPPLARAKLIRRYKRFLADIEYQGQITTIHCPNTGSMRNCIQEGSPCWFSRSQNTKRKYPFTWEIATTPAGDLAGINTLRANALVREALGAKRIPELAEYKSFKTEYRIPGTNSRLDFAFLEEGTNCFMEVKNLTLAEEENGNKHGYFPDAVSERAHKHLQALLQLKREGNRSILFFCVQHSAVEDFAPAAHIDAKYADLFYQAVDEGVEVLAYRAELGPDEIVLKDALARRQQAYCM